MTAKELKVRVLFFASLREEVGKESLSLELRAADFPALRAAIVAELGDQADALWADNVRVARNQELQAEVASLTLEDRDEIAFLPPVTGG